MSKPPNPVGRSEENYKLKLSLDIVGRSSLYCELTMGPRLTGGPQGPNLSRAVDGTADAAIASATAIAKNDAFMTLPPPCAWPKTDRPWVAGQVLQTSLHSKFDDHESSPTSPRWRGGRGPRLLADLHPDPRAVADALVRLAFEAVSVWTTGSVADTSRVFWSGDS